MFYAIFNNCNTRCSLAEVIGKKRNFISFGSTSEMNNYLNKYAINVPLSNCFASFDEFNKHFINL